MQAHKSIPAKHIEGVQRISRALPPPRSIPGCRLDDYSFWQPFDANFHLCMAAIGRIEVTETLSETFKDVMPLVDPIVPKRRAYVLDGELGRVLHRPYQSAFCPSRSQ